MDDNSAKKEQNIARWFVRMTTGLYYQDFAIGYGQVGFSYKEKPHLCVETESGEIYVVMEIRQLCSVTAEN